MSVSYRRSPHLMSYWSGSTLVLENFAEGTRVAATPRACELLHFFDRWRTAGELARAFGGRRPRALAGELAELVRFSLVERSGAPRHDRVEALTTWADWSPEASFFHLSTRDAHAPIDTDDAVRLLRRRARRRPMPLPVKTYRDRRRIALPAAPPTGEFASVLLARRTWRRFARTPIALDQLSTLLGLSFGAQWWVDLRGIGRVALKTSPSGGSRHPIEAYVLALRVQGLARGLYHYDGGAHALERLRRGASARHVSRYLNGQRWFGGAGALVLMTAVFARTQWKYPGPRAYRVVLADAGHVCQTFCLAATWLGLAPFCTMALADSAIERDLGIDGVTESVMYAAGVGTRPAGGGWEPWHSKPYGRRVPNPRLYAAR